ncbi:MAG: hypothetical protein Q4P71_03130 [Actinomycetaceae bacterium]|nr:hypothetical protein [Actinomycetaceae bacterium]
MDTILDSHSEAVRAEVGHRDSSTVDAGGFRHNRQYLLGGFTFGIGFLVHPLVRSKLFSLDFLVSRQALFARQGSWHPRLQFLVMTLVTDLAESSVTLVTRIANPQCHNS